MLILHKSDSSLIIGKAAWVNTGSPSLLRDALVLVKPINEWMAWYFIDLNHGSDMGIWLPIKLAYLVCQWHAREYHSYTYTIVRISPSKIDRYRSSTWETMILAFPHTNQCYLCQRNVRNTRWKEATYIISAYFNKKISCIFKERSSWKRNIFEVMSRGILMRSRCRKRKLFYSIYSQNGP